MLSGEVQGPAMQIRLGYHSLLHLDAQCERVHNVHVKYKEATVFETKPCV